MGVVKYSGFSLGVVKHVVGLCSGCDGYCTFCLNYEAWRCRCSYMSDLSGRCCMFESCVYSVAVLNAVFCMTCRLLLLVKDARGDHIEEAYSRGVQKEPAL